MTALWTNQHNFNYANDFVKDLASGIWQCCRLLHNFQRLGEILAHLHSSGRSRCVFVAVLTITSHLTKFQPVLGISHAITDTLRLPPRSTIAYFIHLTTAFAISAFFHIISLAAIRSDNISLPDLIGDMSIFFIAQPIATVAETLVIDFYRKLGSSKGVPEPGRGLQKSTSRTSLAAETPPRLLFRVIGYVWVLCWFVFTGWWFTKGYIAIGARDWPVPFSFWGSMKRTTSIGTNSE